MFGDFPAAGKTVNDCDLFHSSREIKVFFCLGNNQLKLNVPAQGTERQKMNKTIKTATFLVLTLVTSSAHAVWTQFTLPSLSADYFTASFGNLPDGRFVFGEHGNLYLQNVWGAADVTAFQNEPTVDPSFISVFNADSAVLGSGGWGASPIHSFNPDNTTSSFSAIGGNIQNYDGVMRDANSVFTAGADTGTGGNRHGIRYSTLDGSVRKVVISDVSQYSAGIALDSAGNLFVGDNDDGKVYLFAKSLIDSAIAGSSLSIGDGTLVCDFGAGGDISSIAVDGRGVIWAGGYLHNGLKSYNPANGLWGTFIPGLSNSNYKVSSFANNGTNYVAYINSAATGVGAWGNYPQNGDSVSYGYQNALAIPEPMPATLLFMGILTIIINRRRSNET
jgi:hypothetical protein